MKDILKIRLFYPSYFSFFVNGIVALLIGSILPFIINETGISYATAGTLLSVFAIGNFLASFTYPALAKLIGRKATCIFISSLLPVSLVFISLLPPVSVMTVLFTVVGICRGTSSIINNAYMNEKGDGSASSLNLLHATFAVGAFLAPTLISVLLKVNLTWHQVIYFICAVTLISVFFNSQMDFSKKAEKTLDDGNDSSPAKTIKNTKKFWREPIFYVTGFVMFFYIGFENCVNGWFVTYFKNSGVMSETYANELVSFTWFAILAGRVINSFVSARIKEKWLILINCLAATAFFLLMISTMNLVLLTICIIGLGFFMAGIYPNGVSNASPAIKDSDLGTSLFLSISAFGGIITPQIFGIIAEKAGLNAAIGMLILNVSLMILLAVINIFYSRRRS